MVFLLRDKAADSLRKNTFQMTFTCSVDIYCAIDRKDARCRTYTQDNKSCNECQMLHIRDTILHLKCMF